MAFFPVDRDPGNAPRFTEQQGPNQQVHRPSHSAQSSHQRRSPRSRVSTARSQEFLSTILENPDSRPCSIASPESKGLESPIATPPVSTLSPGPQTSPHHRQSPPYDEVPPPLDHQAPPPYSQLLTSETLVYAYRTSEPHPEAGSYRYDVIGEQGYTHSARETRLRGRGNTHREFYRNPNSSDSSDIPNNARRERTYRDGLVEIDDNWRNRDLGHMYRGEEVDLIRRNITRDNREERSRRQSEREQERHPRRKVSHRCVIL
ncbi:hypothetical protein Vi05172_g1823 [Venturia inaequalis]|nr:hypothetical protein Vi05172_g1823 [Venturia inaequalis]